jgi:hypothetical protein
VRHLSEALYLTMRQRLVVCIHTGQCHRNSLYTHRGLDGRTSSDRPGALTPDTSPPSPPESVDEPEGAAWEDEGKIF